MQRFFSLAFIGLVAIAAADLDAQALGETPLSQEYLQFTSGSGVNGGWGVQVGPYEGRFLASSTTGRSLASSTFALYCVDYAHFASNSNGLVNVTEISASSGFGDTRLGSFDRYRRAAYLSSLFESWEVHRDAIGGGYSQSTIWGGLHAAIWFETTGGDIGADFPEGDPALLAARDYFAGLATPGDFSTNGWYVLSEADVALGDLASGQEFLVQVSVPEPATFLLLATGLLFLAGVSRRRLVDA